MTERKTTGASKLIEIIKEVYDTKKRMKVSINKFVESNSDDFEEYSQLTSWILVDQYNKGYMNGYIDGWHVVFPDDVVDPEDYEEGWKEYPAPFTPSIPSYSTDTYIDNLVDIMKDNYRCRMLLKAALNTSTDEFVTYPDLLEQGAGTEYDTGYNLGYQTGLDKATDLSFGKPIIVHVRGSNTVQIIANAQISGTTLYYWTGSSAERHEYTGQFILDHSDIVYATNMLNGRIGPIARQYCDILDYSEINYATVRLPVGVSSAKFSVEAVIYGSGTIVPVGGYGGQYSYDKVNWYDIPITTDTGWPYDIHQLMTFTLSGTNNEMYFKAKNFGNGCYALLYFDSHHDYVVTGSEVIEDQGHEYTGQTVYYIAEYDITNPTAIDIASNWSSCRVSQLLINSAQYATDINDKLAGHTETKRGADMLTFYKGEWYREQYWNGDNWSNLFNGCTSMNYICCLIMPDQYTPHNNWVNNVAANGVFIKNPYSTWTTGASGIPSGWTAYNYQMALDLNVNAPTITQIGNTVSMSSNNTGDYINLFYYTSSDGTIREYSSTITLSDNEIFYAFATKNNLYRSETTSFNAVYDCITISQNFDKITITSDKGGSIYYYFDGDDENPIAYTGTFRITESHTITAYVSGYAEHTTVCTWTGWENHPLYLEALEDGQITMSDGRFEWITYNVTAGEYIQAHSISYNRLIKANETNVRHNAMGKLSSVVGSNTQAGLFAGDIYLIDASKIKVDIIGQYIIPGQYTTGGGPTAQMFSGCTNLVSAPSLPETTLTEGCYSNMFYGCTSLQTAPILPATTLVKTCYSHMFYGCTGLKNITCLATDMSANSCLYNWTNGVSSTGTFTKASGVTWQSGESGIPTGWTVIDAA